MVVTDNGCAWSEGEEMGLKRDICKGQKRTGAVGGLHDDGDGLIVGVESPFDRVEDLLVLFRGGGGRLRV